MEAVIKDPAGKFVLELPFFAGLPASDISAFAAAGRTKDHKKGSALFHLGDAADRFFVVLSGWIKLYRETGDGEEAVVALFKRGDVFGEAAIFNGAGYPFSAVAVEDSRVIEISAKVLRERARDNHDIMDKVMASMSKELRDLQLENEHLSLMSAPQRVGCLLLQLSAGMIGKGGTFAFPYDKSLAATRLGMKPETFSRALALLKPLGVTVSGPEVKVESFSCLIDYCCGHCSSFPGECPGCVRSPEDVKAPCAGKKTGTCS